MVYSNTGSGVGDGENLNKIDVAVQAKRWKGNVGPEIIRELRGSLKNHEHGIVIAPGNFTSSAKEEADEPGKTHISLINGDQLVDLSIFQIGFRFIERCVTNAIPFRISLCSYRWP